MILQEKSNRFITVLCEKCGLNHKIHRVYYKQYGNEYHLNPPISCSCGNTDGIAFENKLIDPSRFLKIDNTAKESLPIRLEKSEPNEIEQRGENTVQDLEIKDDIPQNNTGAIIRVTDKAMDRRKFDLNIERILDNWEIYHAIREIIANALDEQLLTKTKEVEIFKSATNEWHIRDFGRGIIYEHLTQKENEEKLTNPNLIGKFGIGLKDALATFDRKGVKVLIKSKYGNISLEKSQKYDFEDIVTLHAYFSSPLDPKFMGSEFIFNGVTDRDIEMAKSLFLRFSSENILDTTQYGQIIKKSNTSSIYLNGVKVAEEENFIFSYNITLLDSKIKRALNRERTNVGRSAYSERIKAILKSTNNIEVVKILANDLKNFSNGQVHDELKWIDVQEHAVKILNSFSQVVFLTSQEIIDSPDFVDRARNEFIEIVTIPDNLKEKVQGQQDIKGNPIRESNEFFRQYNDSFEFEFVEPSNLTMTEKEVFSLTDNIFTLIGGRPRNVREISISETMRKELGLSTETTGLWQPSQGRIIIKRSQLNSITSYAGSLLHEAIHAASGADDVTRDFEQALTRAIGLLCSKLLK